MMPSITQNNLIFRSDFTTITEQPIRKLFQYQLTSNLNFYSSGQLTSQQAEIETRLPQWSNQKSIEFARQLYQKSNNTADYIDKILNHFTTEQFYYTLKPPFLGKNSVDDFLFTSKKGFCEHYASSFAFLMRAVNIPARVVVGYQGGEINPLGDYVVVHQYDAHAWNEVWIENRGWVRFDPTAAISPTRIEKGIEQAVSNEDSFLENDYLSLSRYKSNNLINSIRLYLDSANYLWNQWVVNYNTQKQLDFFKNWFKGFTRETIILLLGIFISCTTLLLSYFFILKLKPKSVDPLTRDYLHFCKQLNKKGLHRLEIDTPQTFANKIILKHPELTDRINYLTYLYNETQYGNKKNNDDKIKQAMKRIIKKIHKQS